MMSVYATMQANAIEAMCLIGALVTAIVVVAILIDGRRS